MNYEEKYNDLLSRIKRMADVQPDVTRMAIESLFPELKESDDERIRKEILEYFQQFENEELRGVNISDWIAWLEKQSEQKYIPKYKIGDYVKNTNYKGEPIYEIVYMDKECYICEYRGNERMGDKAVMHFSFDNPYLRLVQKPADKVEQKGMNIVEEDMTPFQKKVFCIIDTTIEEEHGLKQVCDELLRLAHDEIIQKPAWSEEAEEHVNSLLKRLEGLCRNEFATTRFAISEDEDWLKSLKDRVQPKQEWSEEDCNQIETIACHLDNIGNGAMAESLLNIMDKYKSLRLQNTWKPSDEQMENLSRAFNGGTYRASLLMELYQDLKKLK